jgi:SAM-dependent methyltransferase
MKRHSFVPDSVHKYNGERTPFDEWLGTEPGRYLLQWELAQFASAVDDVFGYKAAQLGLPRIDFLQENRIAFRFNAALENGAAVVADPLQLPFAGNSLDLIALPHVLEFHNDPHQVLREVERILVPEGQVVISGFNPLSLWGMRHAFSSRRAGAPWDANFIGLIRLKDWLKLLGFELNGGVFGCYAPPFGTSTWLSRFAFMEKAGSRWWPIMGGAYVVRAVKRVHGARMIAPAWREERARRRALAGVPQQQRNGQGMRRDGNTKRDG